MMKPKKPGLVVAIGVGKPKGPSPADYGSTMSDEPDPSNPDAADDVAGDDSPDGDADADDQNEQGEPKISLPPGYQPPDDAKPGEEIPVLAKIKIDPNDPSIAYLCSLDGAPFAKDEAENDDSNQSEMKLDQDTPPPDEEQNPNPPEDMNNAPGSMSDRLSKLRMKLKGR